MKPRFSTLVLTLGALVLLAGAVALWSGLSRQAPAPPPAGPAPGAPPGTTAPPSKMIGTSALSHGDPTSEGIAAPGTLRRGDGRAPAAEDQGAGR